MRSLLLVCVLCFTLSGAPKPQVKFKTTLGSFTLELDRDAAPKTVENFLFYVRNGHYKGTIFHRVIPDFMVQGGGHLPDLSERFAGRSVENEADVAQAKGLTNTRGTVAMARQSLPHSATAQFFINVVNNNRLDFNSRTQNGWGYCPFGRVIEGMDTVDKIREVPTQTIQKRWVSLENVPVKPVEILECTLLGDKPQKTLPAAKKQKGSKKN